VSRLAGKVALVTGASAGIGEAIARLFAREGAAVVITGRRKEVLDRVARAITQEGGRALAVAGSVTDGQHARDAVAQAVRTFGRLNVLVNNAGLGAFGKPLHEEQEGVWEELLDVNLTGVFHMTKAAVPEMLKAGGGSIINISSIASLVASPCVRPTAPPRAASMRSPAAWRSTTPRRASAATASTPAWWRPPWPPASPATRSG